MKTKVGALVAVMMMFGGAIAQAADTTSEPRAIKIEVTKKGFEPKSIDVKPGSNVVLKVTRKTDSTCAKKIKIPSKNITIDLKELDKEYSAELGKLEKGEVRFACGMDMITGIINVK